MEIKYKMNWKENGQEVVKTFWAKNSVHAKNLAKKIAENNQVKVGYGYCEVLPQETR